MNLIRRARNRQSERAAKAQWNAPGRPEWELAAQKLWSEHKMAEYEAAAAVVGYDRARLTDTELRAGPLLTDRWRVRPRMDGIGRRLGSLNAAEMEADE